MNDKVSIYALLDPDTLSVGYVGQSAHVSQRFAQHLANARDRDSSPVERWITGILDRGKQPRLQILETIDAGQATNRETWWINHLMTAGEPLANVRQTANEPSGTVRFARKSLKLTESQWAHLDELASDTNSLAPTGTTAGKPSWRTLIKRISSQELEVV